MNRQAAQLITRAAINKIGNMLYDYGNSIWLASLGALGQTVLGIYQISELVTSILFNPLGGAITDRFSRRKVLMVTDLICAGLCLLISFISNDQLMIGALIFANVVQAIAFAFSRPANKSYITEIVDKEDIVIYNSHLELALQVISVSAPVLSFIVMQYANLRMTLQLDALSFFLAFALVYFLPNHEPSKQKSPINLRNILGDIKEGLVYIFKTKEIVGALTLDLFAVLFGGAVALITVFAKDILQLGVVGYGFLNAATDIGATISVFTLTLFPLRRNQGKILLFSVFGFGLCILLFGISEYFILSFIALLMSGILDGISGVIRGTIVQLKTPNHMRGRVMSINSMFVMSSNELGQFESGVAARIFGAVNAVIIGGGITMLIALLVSFSSPKLRKMEY